MEIRMEKKKRWRIFDGCLDRLTFSRPPVTRGPRAGGDGGQSAGTGRGSAGGCH